MLSTRLSKLRSQLLVQDTAGGTRQIEVVIDTGFNGSLTLPFVLIAALGLPWLCRQQGLLADGSVQVFDVYTATVIWDGRPRTVEVECIEATPLVGMALLQGHELRIQVVSGGAVIIVGFP